MKIDEILSLLQNSSNEKRKQMHIKNGASDNTYGVLLGELRKIAKQLGKNQELGLELWHSGNTDAQWLACMILDVNQLSLDEIRMMVAPLTYFIIIDKFIGEVVCYHKDADILSKEWMATDNDYLGRAGWYLIVDKISSGKLTNTELEKILTRIEVELPSATPRKQWAVNHAMCEIGIRYPQFTNRCVMLGETIGVYRELKVSKGCTSAYAPAWIAAGIKNRK